MIERYRGHVFTEEFQGIDLPPVFRVAKASPSGNFLERQFGTHQTREAARAEVDKLAVEVERCLTCGYPESRCICPKG